MEKTFQERLEPILERWERGEFSHWDESFSPDMVVTGFDADGTHVSRGQVEIAERLGRFFEQFNDYRIEVGELQGLSEDTLLLEGHQIGTGRRSGLEIRETLFIVFRFDSGLLTEMHWHPRRDGALDAAGLG